MIYRALLMIFRLALNGFYRHVEVENAENLPQAGPVMFLPNHPNSIVDPFLVLTLVRREVSLTAKNTLTKNPFLALLFKLGRVIPIHRRKDLAEGSDPSRNEDSLREIKKRLAEGGAVLMFPEGVSYNDVSLQPLKTGAARVALGLVDDMGNPGGLKLVPVGYHYPLKQRFRSTALVRIGEPLDVGAWRKKNRKAGPRELTAEIERRLRNLTLNFEKRKHSVILNQAARLLLTGGDRPASIGFQADETARLAKIIDRLQKTYRGLKGPALERADALGSRIRIYMASLDRLGIHPREVFIRLSTGHGLRFLAREIPILLLGLPLAYWGLFIHLPLVLVTAIMVQLSATERDLWAAYTVFPVVLFGPFYYLLLAWLALNNMTILQASVFIFFMPVSGFALLHLRDRWRAMTRRASTYLRFRFNPGLRGELIGEARAILAGLKAIAK